MPICRSGPSGGKVRKSGMRTEKERIVVPFIGGQFFPPRDQIDIFRQAEVVMLDLFGRTQQTRREPPRQRGFPQTVQPREKHASAGCVPARSCLRAWSARAGCPRNSQTRSCNASRMRARHFANRCAPVDHHETFRFRFGQREIAPSDALVEGRALLVDTRFRVPGPCVPPLRAAPGWFRDRYRSAA